MISLYNYLTSSGSYKSREQQATPEIKANAEELLKRVNALLEELGVKRVSISSGFRPAEANAATGGAKKSSHMTGKALDIFISKNEKDSPLRTISKELLEKHDLYMENPNYTKGKFSDWCHLQTTPTKSGNRIFIP